MACYSYQRGWRASMGYVIGAGDVVGVPSWVRQLMCQCGWRTKVNSDGDIGGNNAGEVASMMGGTLFIKFFPKTRRK